MPCARWKVATARSVVAPKFPSTATPPRPRWSTFTALPCEPLASTSSLTRVNQVSVRTTEPLLGEDEGAGEVVGDVESGEPLGVGVGSASGSPFASSGCSFPEVLSGAGSVLPLSSGVDRKSTRLNSSHVSILYAVFCLKKQMVYNIGILPLLGYFSSCH